MSESRKNEFIELLDKSECVYFENKYFIKADITNLGEVTYYPKKNRLNIHSGNIWKSDAINFIKTRLNKSKTIRQLIIKYFDECDISYCFEDANYVDDTFFDIEEAINKICNEYKNQ